MSVLDWLKILNIKTFENVFILESFYILIFYNCYYCLVVSTPLQSFIMYGLTKEYVPYREVKAPAKFNVLENFAYLLNTLPNVNKAVPAIKT